MISPDRAEKVSAEILNELKENGAITATLREPTIWAPPVPRGGGLVVEVGRRGDDVLYHFWNNHFPEDFGEQLFDAVSRVMKAPERFQAAATPEIMAVWDPQKEELHIGPEETIKTYAVIPPTRRVRSWAMKAMGYAPIPEAHDRLTGALVDAIEAIFIPN